MSNYLLGPLPWSEQVLQQAYFRNFTDTQKAIKEHQGFVAHDALCALQLSLDLFLDAVSELFQSTEAFRIEAQLPEFWSRPARSRFNRRELAVRRGVFTAATSALALVDASRRIRKKITVVDYNVKVSEIFAEEHQFIQQLRRENMCLDKNARAANGGIAIATQQRKRSRRKGDAFIFRPSPRDLILFADPMVDSNEPGVVEGSGPDIGKEVVRTGCIGCRPELQQRLGNWIGHAGALSVGRDDCRTRSGSYLAETFPGGKEESLVFQDWSPQRCAVLIPMERVLWLAVFVGEKIGRVQF